MYMHVCACDGNMYMYMHVTDTLPIRKLRRTVWYGIVQWWVQTPVSLSPFMFVCWNSPRQEIDQR